MARSMLCLVEDFCSNMLNMCVLSHGVLDGYFLLIVRSGRVFRPTNGGQMLGVVMAVCAVSARSWHAVSCGAWRESLGRWGKILPATPRRRAVRAGSVRARGARPVRVSSGFSKDMYTTRGAPVYRRYATLRSHPHAARSRLPNAHSTAFTLLTSYARGQHRPPTGPHSTPCSTLGVRSHILYRYTTCMRCTLACACKQTRPRAGIIIFDSR